MVILTGAFFLVQLPQLHICSYCIFFFALAVDTIEEEKGENKERGRSSSSRKQQANLHPLKQQQRRRRRRCCRRAPDRPHTHTRTHTCTGDDKNVLLSITHKKEI